MLLKQNVFVRRVGTLFGSSLVFHSIFVIEGRRSSSACDLSSAVIKAEG